MRFRRPRLRKRSRHDEWTSAETVTWPQCCCRSQGDQGDQVAERETRKETRQTSEKNQGEGDQQMGAGSRNQGDQLTNDENTDCSLCAESELGKEL